MPPHVFIAASSKDYELAQKVYDFLTARQIEVFFSKESLPALGSSDYRKQIDAALDQALHMVVVTSSADHLQSPWLEYEWGSFANEMRSGRKIGGNLVTVVSGRIQLSDLPLSLRNYEVIPFERLGRVLDYFRGRRDKVLESVLKSDASASRSRDLLGDEPASASHGKSEMIDPTYLTIEQLRARLSIQSAKLTARLVAGAKPSVEFSFVNTGRTAAEKVTYACQVLVTPSLPRWEPFEFDKIAAAHGHAFPKRDEFYSTTIEPNTTKIVAIPFQTLAEYMNAFRKPEHSFLQIGATSSFGPDRRPMTMRVFFVGLADYNTMGQTYRLRFCYTPTTYPGTTLVEAGQWNNTEIVGAGAPSGTRAGRQKRRVTANVVPINVKFSTGEKILDSTTRMSILFFNLGPTSAMDLRITVSIGTSDQIAQGPHESVEPVGKGNTLRPEHGLYMPQTVPLEEIVGTDQVAAVASGRLPLIASCTIAYKDAWDDVFTSKFTLTFDPKTVAFRKTSEEKMSGE